MAVPGSESGSANAGGDPLGRDAPGSVVGIQFEVTGMYTGTLIEDLMAAVEDAQYKSEQRRIAEAEELHEIFSMQLGVLDNGHLLMGAA
jgi:hypothetical protein